MEGFKLFKLADEQIEELKRWKSAQNDERYFHWYEDQKKNSEEIRQILREADFEKGNNLSLEEFYRISRLLTENLGNTQLKITGEKSIFESNNLKTCNKKLWNLLFGRSPLIDRVDNFLGLKRVGIMTMSQFLCMFNHREYPFFANFMIDVFDFLSLEETQLEKARKQAKREFGITQGKYHDTAEDFFEYYVILREMKNALNFESYLEVQNLLWRIFYYREQPAEEEGIAPQKEDIPDILEEPLREFIARNLETVEKGLKLVATKYRTKAGEIDILCKDAEDRFVVIEVKRWKDSDKVAGQILRYMGAIKEEKSSEPRGIIVLNQDDLRLNYALSMVKNVEAKYYKLNFTISDTPPS
jgi:Holliday junction resolvase-like predicted endonuclease